MLRLSRSILFCILLALPTLTLAQTVFDVSGTIQGTGVLYSVGFSGTLTLTPTDVLGGFTVSNWNISLPAIPLTNGGSLPAFVFTPANSTGSVQTQSQDEGLFTFINLNDAQTQTSLHLDFNPLNISTTNQGATVFDSVPNGVVDANDGSVTLSPVPEPSSGVLLATGLVGLAVVGRKLLTRPVPTLHS
jgi:hypothetical protein